jgi:ribonucleoside-diphosphate reductase alpha chain
MTEMFEYVNRNGQYAPLIADDVYKVIQENAEFLDSHIIYNRDFNWLFWIQNIRTFLFA